MRTYYYEVETDEFKRCPKYITIVADTMELAIERFKKYVKENNHFEHSGSIVRVAGIERIDEIKSVILYPEP